MSEKNGGRLPAKSVWMINTKVPRKNPRTGRKKKVRRFLVRWREGNRSRQQSFEDPVKAGRFAARKEEEILGHRTTPDGPDTLFTAWRDAYLSARFPEYALFLSGETDRIRGKYLSLLVTAFRKFAEKIGDRPLRSYAPTDFERFRSELTSSKKLRPVTVENHLTRVRTLFLAAEQEGLLTKAPRICVHQPHYEKTALEQEEIKEIFEAARNWPPPSSHDRRRFGDLTGRIYRILAFLYYTMVRRGELIHLTWNDLRKTPQGGLEILIQPTEWREQGPDGRSEVCRWEPKDREIRAIPVHSVVKEVLAQQRKQNAHPSWIFTNHKGQRWTEGGLASLLHRFETATGWRIGFHLWRRSGLTHLHDEGVPPGQIQAIAGHSSLSTTMRYVRPGGKGRREAIDALKPL